MKILLITAGSRGDVEPFAALARRAAADGHEVRLALPDNSGVATGDLDVVSVRADFSSLIQDQGVSAREAMRSFRTVVKPTMRAVLLGAVTHALAFEPDVIVYHPKILSGPIAADALGIPHILAEIVPAVTPTREFPAPGTVGTALGPLNRLTYGAVALSSRMFSAELAEARDLAGSGRRASAPTASLIPVSPQILARPADWPGRVHLTGAWHGPATESAPDPAVAAFIEAGTFLYAGFGSMVLGDPVARARIVVEAARKRGLRVLLATGLGGLDLEPSLAGDDVLAVPSVDHATVLPRAVAAIHHGGSGTVHAAARAGVPSIVVPFFADQPFWAAQVHRAGLGPEPLPQKRLTGDRLGSRLDTVGRYTDHAREVAELMRSEDGADTALSLIERYVERATSR